MNGWYRIKIAYAGEYYSPGEPVYVAKSYESGRAVIKYAGQRGFGYIQAEELEPAPLWLVTYAIVKHLMTRKTLLH